MKKRIIVESHTPAQTRKFGKLLGQSLGLGSVVGLSGELGSGKTQFIKGLASGLGVSKRYQVSSPSFVLINEYPGRITLYHIDLYRLSGAKDLEEMGLEEYFYGHGVTAIEWAEKATLFMPPRHIWIDIIWRGPTSRQLIIRAAGKSNTRVIDGLYKELKG